MAEHGGSGEIGESKPADLNRLRDNLAAGEDVKEAIPPSEGLADAKPGKPPEQGDEFDDLAGLRAQLEKDKGPLGGTAKESVEEEGT